MEFRDYSEVMLNHSKALKRISAKTVAERLFIKEATMCFFTEYYVKPYIKNEFRLIDCTMGGDKSHEEFYKVSIPTSCYLDTSKEMVNPDSIYPNGFPTKQQVIDAMQDLGVSKSDTIVLYSQPHRDSSMTRVWVILNSYGFEDVSILDGGLLKFQQDGYPTTPGIDYTGEKSIISNLNDPDSYLIKMDEIVEFAKGQKPTMQLIDTRDEKSFHGHATDNIPGCKQGHVPGAINIPASNFINESNDTFKLYPELVKLFDSYGIDRSKDIVVMCRTGVAATVGFMSLFFAQYPSIRLYDGSWSEYGSNDNPIDTLEARMPMYYQPTLVPTPHIIVLHKGEKYVGIPIDQPNYSVYRR